MIFSIMRACVFSVSFLLAITTVEIPNAKQQTEVLQLKLEYSPAEVLNSDPDICNEQPQCKKLAEAVFFESRGESIDGQYVVAFVVRNRRDNERRWGNTITSVVDQKNAEGYCQFSYVCELDNYTRRVMIKEELDSWDRALQVAYDVYYFAVEDFTHGADHFYNPRKVKRKPRFAEVYEFIAQIDNHAVYKSN